MKTANIPLTVRATHKLLLSAVEYALDTENYTVAGFRTKTDVVEVLRDYIEAGMPASATDHQADACEIVRRFYPRLKA